VKFFIT